MDLEPYMSPSRPAPRQSLKLRSPERTPVLDLSRSRLDSRALAEQMTLAELRSIANTQRITSPIAATINDSRITRLNDVIDELRGKIRMLESESARDKHELNALRADARVKAGTLAGALDEVASLRRRIQDTEAERVAQIEVSRRYERDVRDLEREMKVSADEVSRSRSLLKECQLTSLTDLNAVQTNLRREIADLGQRCQVLDAQVQQRDTQLQQRDAEFVRLQAQNVVLHERAATLERELELQRSQSAAQSSALSGKIDSLTGESDNNRRHLSQSEKMISTLKQQLESQRSQNVALSSSVDTLSAETSGYRRQLAQGETTISSLKQQVESLTAESSGYRRQLAQSESALSTLTQQLNAYRADYDSILMATQESTRYL